jgi:hypothetical protein
MNRVVNKSRAPDSDRGRIIRKKIAMAGKKNIALIARDKNKEELCEWLG